MRVPFIVGLCALLCGVSAVHGATAQVELDRLLVKVGGRALTTLDVQQARTAHLVDDVSSDGAVQRALENRFLALAELSRAGASVAVSEADARERRAAWEAAIGGADAAKRVMTAVEMDEAELTTWFRDDLRVARHLDRQFGSLAPADRARATAEWFSRLRQRADLP